LVCQSDHALFLKQLHHCRLECYHQDDWGDKNTRQEVYWNG
jgi:hypothetical protein